MKIYNIDPEEYFNNINSKDFLDVSESMLQLINHFNLQDKKVFSIGAGWGFEEFWMYQKGCRLTLVDIDLPNLFDSYLKILKLKGSMKYIIGDIYKVVKEFEERYDLLYISGMHKDMMWNGNLFSDLIIKCIEKFLYKGLFICRTSHGGLKMDDPISVKLITDQCEREGLVLISIYHFHPIRTNVSLIVVFKGNERELNKYMESIKGNTEITRFHGRSKMVTEIKKVYQYESL